MRRLFPASKNCLLLSISVLTLAYGASAQQKTAPPKQAPAKNAAVVKPKIRTITAFIQFGPISLSSIFFCLSSFVFLSLFRLRCCLCSGETTK